MIFSNEGLCQIGGNPLQNTLELTQIIRTIRRRSGEDGELADTIVVLAGRLSLLDEKDQDAFVTTIPRDRPVSVGEVMELLEKFSETRH